MPKVETRHLKDGTARHFVRYADPVTGRRTSKVWAVKREAEAFARKLERLGPARTLAEMDTDERFAASPTLDEWAARYFASLTGVTPGTLVSYDRIYKRCWSPQLGRDRLAAITRESVAHALGQVKGADKTVKNAWGVLASLMKAALADGLITRNPCTGVKLPRATDHERVEHRYLAPAEFGRLIAEIPEHWRPLVLTLAGTGMRWGEAAALRPSDVNLDAKTVRVLRAEKWDPSTSTRAIGPTKTQRSRRTVTLPSEVVEILRPLVAAKRERLFVASKGGPVRHRTFWSDVWRPAIERAGIVPPPRIHDLRHSHVAWLIAAGKSLTVIQHRLGHSTISVTSDTYGHLLPEVQAAAADAADVVLRGIALPQIGAAT